jgi:cytochrome P450
MGRARRDPLTFLMSGARDFGDIFRYQLGPFTFQLISKPELIKHVLADNYANYPRSFLYRFTKMVIGDGLVSTEGDQWRLQRRMVQPAFKADRIAPLAKAMATATKAMLDGWKTGEVIDVADEMMRLTLRIVGTTLLGVELGGEADRMSPAIIESLGYMDYRINSLIALPLVVPTPRNLRFRRAMKTMNEVVYDIIARRRADGARGEDLLSMLLELRDEETHQAMSDREVRDQVATFIGAGHETTAVTLTWTLALLAQHPEIEARVRDEIGHVLGGRTPGVEDLAALSLTRRVIQESLRLYPPIVAVARDVLKEDEMGGYRIPAKSTVVLSQWVTQRHPEVWENPEVFDPDRFTPERSAGRHRFAWFPFLGGPHQCIGEQFAMMETMLILVMVYQRFRLELVSKEAIVPRVMLSLRPKDGLVMRVFHAGD